jgi:CBS domain-containing protein
MVAHGVHRVLVLDAGGELIGIVTPMDLLRRLLDEGHLEAADEHGAGAHAARPHAVTHH